MTHSTGTSLYDLIKAAEEIPEVSCVAVVRHGKILMGRRRDSKRWTTPGGHLNPGEDPVSGAVREVKEEAGIDIEPHTLKHLKTEVVTKPDGKKIKVHAFRAVIHKAPTSIKEDPDAEVHRWHWLSAETLLSPKVWGELHVKPEENVIMKGLGLVMEKKALKAPKHPDEWYPKDQIEKGMVVEKEHSNDPKVRSTITKNHLDERRDYYNNPLFKSDLTKEGSMQSFWNGFEKQAKLSLSDVEKHLGYWHADGDSPIYLGKHETDVAEKGIADATANSFAIRHPWLTGIPTLGIWPSMAHANALDDISHRVLRESPTLRTTVDRLKEEQARRWKQEEEEEHRREVELMPKHIEDRKRQSYENMLGTAALAGMAIAGRHYDSKDKEDKTAAERSSTHKSYSFFGPGREKMTEEDRKKLRMRDEIRDRAVADETQMPSRPLARIVGGFYGGSTGGLAGAGMGYHATRNMAPGKLKSIAHFGVPAALAAGGAYAGQAASKWLADRFYVRNKAKMNALKSQLEEMKSDKK